MALTSSVGLAAVFLVDFVDMIFISMLGKAELAAAIGYAGAILFFTSSFGIGMAIASGAGANSLHAIGTGVIGGMLASTLISSFFVPMFFVILESVTGAERHQQPTTSETAAADAGSGEEG